MKSSASNKFRSVPILSLLLTATALAVHILYSSRPHLIYTRTAVAGGELWRLLTCHWVHLNTDHLLWSSITFLILGSLCEIVDRGKYIIAIGLSTILIPIAIWLFKPQLEIYGGLSGVDCTLYSLLIVLFIRQERSVHNWIWMILYSIMLVLLPAKIIYEMSSGLTIFVNNTHTDMVPVPLSHLIGGLIGLIAALPYFSARKVQRIVFILVFQLRVTPPTAKSANRSASYPELATGCKVPSQRDLFGNNHSLV